MFPILLIASKRLADGYVKKFISSQDYPATHIHIIEPLTTIITIDQIREIILLSVRVTQKSLIVIFNFDSAKKESQNAFLKTLEEKNDAIQFILHTSREQAVLPTIISRSKLIRLKSLAKKKEENSKTLTELLSELDMESYTAMTKEKAIAFCDSWLTTFQNHIHSITPAKHNKMITELINVRELIVKNNINPQLSVDHLILLMKHVL